MSCAVVITGNVSQSIMVKALNCNVFFAADADANVPHGGGQGEVLGGEQAAPQGNCHHH